MHDGPQETWRGILGDRGLVVALVGYPLSLGPVNWLESRGYLSDWVACRVPTFYLPVGLILRHGPESLSDGFNWYVELWRPSQPEYLGNQLE